MTDTIFQRQNYNWKTTIRQRLNAHVCELCGSKTAQLYEVHVVRNLNELGNSPWEAAMKAKRRKTLVICSECHRKIHEPDFPLVQVEQVLQVLQRHCVLLAGEKKIGNFHRLH